MEKLEKIDADDSKELKIIKDLGDFRVEGNSGTGRQKKKWIEVIGLGYENMGFR